MDRITSALVEALRSELATGVTQAELAQKAGVSQGSISKFLAGKTLTSDNFARLVIVLGGELTFSCNASASNKNMDLNLENEKLRAELEAERAMTQRLESLLRDVMTGIRRTERASPVPAHEERKTG